MSDELNIVVEDNDTTIVEVSPTYASDWHIGATAPASPYTGKIWVKSDEPEDSPLLLRMYVGTKWLAIQLMDIS